MGDRFEQQHFKNVLEKILGEIRRIAKVVGKEPKDLDKPEFFEHAQDITDWDIRRVGGYQTLMKKYFGWQPVEKVKNQKLAEVNVASEIVRVSKDLGVEPWELTRGLLLKHSNLTKYDLDRVGGFGGVIQSHFFPGRDYKTISEQKRHIQYVRALEARIGDIETYMDRIFKSVAEHTAKMRIFINKLDKNITRKFLNSMQVAPMKESHEDPRSVVTIWSDQHFGTKIDREEMAGKNEFNWNISSRRLGLLCEELATYKIEKRRFHQELVVLLIGDNIGGIIHNQEGPNYDLVIHQICGTIKYYAQSLHYLKNFYPSIRVVCQPGNHSRMMHKSSPGRAFHQKYDSFENIIFYSLSQIFVNDPAVRIVVSKAPFSDINVQGNRVYTTHGDTVFSTGEVSKAIQIQKLEQRVNTINADELKCGRRPYDLFATGHVHHPVITQTASGVPIIINGCLIGTDLYALGIGVHSSTPVQIIFESSKKFCQGDIRMIYVERADAHSKYEGIIEPYRYELSAFKGLLPQPGEVML